MLNAGIVGGAGYTAGELIRILLKHGQCHIAYIHSRSQCGKYIHRLHTDLVGDIEQKFVADFSMNVDILFLCLSHGEARQFLGQYNIPQSIKIIDLSQDFRIQSLAQREFVYGLPELNREIIKVAQNIANPGCFATSILLAILPLVREKIIAEHELHICGITGSTGGGHKPGLEGQYSWRSNNFTVYKPFRHQHLAEIEKTLQTINPQCNLKIRFLPFRGPFTRGIYTVSYFKTKLRTGQVRALYKDYYDDSDFVFISDMNPALKQVINTNKCLLYLEKHQHTMMVVSVIDNLIKGASGQAVQNMNLMSGLDETCGLNLKASAY